MLSDNDGSIINIAATHSERPLKDHAIYNISKAGIVMLTKTLACDMGPKVRVNAVSPGLIVWPEGDDNRISATSKAALLKRVPLARQGREDEVAQAVVYLANATYTTGDVLSVAGGRQITL